MCEALIAPRHCLKTKNEQRAAAVFIVADFLYGHGLKLQFLSIKMFFFVSTQTAEFSAKMTGHSMFRAIFIFTFTEKSYSLVQSLEYFSF